MADLKNTTIISNSDLTLPIGTTAQRPNSPVTGMIRYNSDNNETEFYDGDNWRAVNDTNPEATGGTIVDTDIGGVPYRLHIFSQVGNFSLTVTRAGQADYLIVGGGGAGGGVAPQGGYHSGGGGGGAGGFLTGSITLSPQVYAITVGAGGDGGSTSSYTNTNGDDSSAFGLTAVGGGKGYFGGATQAAGDGGSGGGAGRDNRSVGQGTAGQGNNGGEDGSSNSGAGGGGAGTAGGVATGGSSTDAEAKGGNGGAGLLSNITGSNVYYAGGGAGGNGRQNSSTYYGIGGLGGGGNGKIFAGGQFGDAGAPNTGGGGGGGPAYESAVGVLGSAGGSGIVIVRYRRNDSTTVNPTVSRTSTLPLSLGVNNSENRLLRAGQNNLVIDYDAANLASYPGTGTTVNDLSGNANNGTLTNGIVYQGTNYGTFVLDGTGETDGNPTGGYLAVPSGATATTISNYPNGCTYDIWINADTDATDRMSLFFGAGSINHIEIYATSRSFRTEAATQNGKVFSSGTFPDSCRGRWSNFTIVFSNTETNRPVRWYQNGKLFGTGFMGNGNNPSGEYFSFSSIGRATGTATYFYAQSFKGKMSCFSLYNRELSHAEIEKNFNIRRNRFGI